MMAAPLPPGRFIRNWLVDEPEPIFSMLQGEKSFVVGGPERPFYDDQLVKQIPSHALRWFGAFIVLGLTSPSKHSSMIFAL